MPPPVGQFSQDAGGCALFKLAFGFVHNGGGGRSDPCDVLQNEEPRTASVRNVEDIEKQSRALAVEPSTSASDGQVLTRESGNDAIHASAPACAVKGGKVRPDRRWIKRSRFHKRDKLPSSRGFPLHVANGSVVDAKMVESSADAFSKHPDTGAEFEGMYSHIIRRGA